MKKLSAALFISLWLASAALAQTVTGPVPNAGGYGAYNTSPPTCVAGSGCWFQTDANGLLKVAIASGGGTGGTASSFGAAFPATGTAVGFTDGTNMVSGRVRNPGSGALAADAAIVVTDPNAIAAINSPVPAGSNTIGGVKIVDTAGTNLATVKAASTAPVATDTSVVTALNPNSPGIITLGGATPANSVPVVGAGFTFGNMTTSTTTTFKSGAGVLHTVTINQLGTVASTVSIFDNTAGSGTSIAVLNSLSTGEGTYTYDVAFTTGLTITTTGTAAPNVTVSYR